MEDTDATMHQLGLPESQDSADYAWQQELPAKPLIFALSFVDGWLSHTRQHRDFLTSALLNPSDGRLSSDSTTASAQRYLAVLRKHIEE